MTAQEVFDALSAPFDPEAIDWRVGSTTGDKTKGRALAYMDARAAMDRFDSVVGIDRWQCKHEPAGSIMMCSIGIRFTEDDWVWKSDGAGATDFEGEKGAMSDSFKRAAVRWGVGRYLYDIDAPWVAIEPMGKSFKISEAGRKSLDELYLKTITRMGWGSPTDGAAYKLLNAFLNDTLTQPSDAERFRAKYGGMVSQLRVKMRDHLNSQLDRIGGPQREAAE